MHLLVIMVMVDKVINEEIRKVLIVVEDLSILETILSHDSSGSIISYYCLKPGATKKVCLKLKNRIKACKWCIGN